MHVSWVIPVRDGARWLRAAIASALAECSTGDEVIVVDDGSRDDPAGLLPSDPRVRLLRQPASGIVAALERGRREARGALVARLDADDEALPGRMAAQRRAFAEDPSLAAVGGRARVRRDDGPVPEGMRAYVDWVNGLGDLHSQILVESPLFHPAVTFRADAVAEVGGYRAGDFPEDYDLWLRLAARGYRLGNVAAEVVVIRDREDRLTRADARYRREGFDRVRREYLAAVSLPSRPRIALWCGRRGGAPWLRWLRERGDDVVCVVDIGRAHSRQDVPVVSPARLSGIGFDLLLVAVGSRGAREEIREWLARNMPDLVEGQDWLALL